MVPKGVTTKNICVAVYSNIVADAAVSHSLLLRRDSWVIFPLQKYQDVSDTETIIPLKNEASKRDNDKYQNWVKSAVGMIETSTKPT